jgi:NAD+ kinase
MSVVGILVRPDLGAAAPALRQLVDWLRGRAVTAAVEDRIAALLTDLPKDGVVIGAREMVAAQADAIVVLGGDGTLLAASHVIERPVPVLGVNFGSLGFLTEIQLPELFATLEGVLGGTYRWEERRLLRASVRRRGDVPDVTGDVLNDVVVSRTAVSRIVEIDVWIDGSFVSAFRADGLMVCSPTGSTAYNLAAGGPIVHPSLAAMVLTPICPHMLSNRPLVVPDGSVVELRLGGTQGEVVLTLDGQRGVALQPEDVVLVTRSPRTVRLVKAPDRDYYEVLRTKLKWGDSSRRS